MYNTTLIQWNCREIWANYEELQQLLTIYNLKLVCFQETFLKDTNQLNIKNYRQFSHIKTETEPLEVSQS